MPLNRFFFPNLRWFFLLALFFFWPLFSTTVVWRMIATIICIVLFKDVKWRILQQVLFEREPKKSTSNNRQIARTIVKRTKVLSGRKISVTLHNAFTFFQMVIIHRLWGKKPLPLNSWCNAKYLLWALKINTWVSAYHRLYGLLLFIRDEAFLFTF